MDISLAAEKRLKKLLFEEASGFSVTDYIGTCRGSTPVINPVSEAAPGQVQFDHSGLTFFVNAEIAGEFDTCVLDYDRSFFGKGLTATWPHRKGCNCHS